MSAQSKDVTKELQPFIARAVPLMLERDADHLRLASGEATYDAAWYRASEREFSLHLTVEIAGESRESDQPLKVKAGGELRKALADALAERLGELRAA